MTIRHKQSSAKGNAMILAAVLIWGVGTVFMSAAMEHITPFTFNASRSFVGGVTALIPFLLYQRKLTTPGQARGRLQARKGTKKNTNIIIAAIVCGGVLFLAQSTFQFGLLYTTVGKAAFITSLYVVIVPVAGLLFGRKAGKLVWLGVGLAVAGMYFMSLAGGAALNIGDLLMLFSAITSAAQILAIDRFAGESDAFLLTSLQFFVAGSLSLVPALIFENPALPMFRLALPHILYVGVLSGGVGFVLQVKAQKITDPTIASLLFSLEAIVTAFVGWLWLNDLLTDRELIGCALIFAAVVVSQLKLKRKSFFAPKPSAKKPFRKSE